MCDARRSGAWRRRTFFFLKENQEVRKLGRVSTDFYCLKINIERGKEGRGKENQESLWDRIIFSFLFFHYIKTKVSELISLVWVRSSWG